MLDEHIPVELSACIAELFFGLLIWTVMCPWREVTAVTFLMLYPRHGFVELAFELDA